MDSQIRGQGSRIPGSWSARAPDSEILLVGVGRDDWSRSGSPHTKLEV
jgi:hypothetical protein